MYLEKLTLVNFRNYEYAEISFNPNINLIFGLNAQGKTNLLEAIYLLCLSRSFRFAKNQDLLNAGKPTFTIEGILKLDNSLKKVIIIHYRLDGKKEISINHKRLNSHSELFGNFPVVVMSPDDYKVTSGGPSERRKFIDILLSQANVSYLKNLQEYSRTIKQRNKILQNIKEGYHTDEKSINPWTQNLVIKGSKIIQSRRLFIEDFLDTVDPIYKKLTDSKDILQIEMETSVPLKDKMTLEESFYSTLKKNKDRERFAGMTLVGPHRDDIVFKINGKEVRKYGSRGEHKSVLIALKLAEFKFLKKKSEETPLFLFDDFYSELDDFREEKVFALIKDVHQIFLTNPKQTINKKYADKYNRFKNISQYYIKDGHIEKLCKY